jgi:hypothetical protein
MKALLQAGLAGRVSAPPEKRFLITFIERKRWKLNEPPAPKEKEHNQ